MATLPETAEWVAGIYQIEQTDPVLGGAPNEGTKAGLTNIPTAQLARRTKWLKQLAENTGVSQEVGKEVTDFDAISASGFYYGSGAIPGTPDPTGTIILLHMPGSTGNFAYQIAARSGSVDRMWYRRKASGSWNPWIEIVGSDKLQTSALDSTAGRILLTGAFGIGGNAATTTNLNTIAATGVYEFTYTATGCPPGIIDGDAVALCIVGAGQNSQIVFGNDGAVYTRMDDLLGGGWTSWVELVHSGNIGNSGIFGARAFTNNGYQTLPSGLIIQWGSTNQSSTAASGSAAITFPIAFPAAVRQVYAHDPNDSIDTIGWDVTARAATMTGFEMAWARSRGSTGAPGTINWFAIGN